MHVDVGTLSRFYYDSHLGAVAQRSLQRTFRGLWPNCRGETVVGYGFAAPFLRPFRKEAARTLCLMPEQQGVRIWPREGPNATALVPEGLWPLPNGFVNRLIVVHALETDSRLDATLEEIWRVLAPEGRALIVAANRSGLWARSESTPFGVGRTFSHRQLERMLIAHKLSPLGREAALFFPPSERRFWLRTAGAAERMGHRLDAQRLAGAVIVEAGKQVFARPSNGARETVADILAPIKGLAAPKPAGAPSRRGRSADRISRTGSPR